MQVPVDKLRSLYCDQLLSSTDIAELFHCSKNSVLYALKKRQIPMRNGSIAHQTVSYKQKFKQYDIPEDLLYAEYVGKGRILRDIARDLGCSCSYIRKKAIAYGIPIRSKSDAMKTPERAAAQLVIKHSEKFREANRQGQLKRYQSQDARDKTGAAMRKYHEEHPDFSQRQTDILTKARLNPDSQRKASDNSKKMWEEHPELRVKRGADAKKMWQDPEIRSRILSNRSIFWGDKDNPKVIQARKKMMAGMNISPNKPERTVQSILDELVPNEWEFVGDGQVILGGLNPDFINVNGKKLILEVFGDYWHKQQVKPYRVNEERIKIYADYGYNTLIVWEKETKDIESLKLKIKSFVSQVVH
jgi:G:T-mismatch repair DNA endonuclease (very short patch repair protein)